ncbi:hypothetical protein N7467_007641, partial [Penicillium canescens]
PLPFSPLWPLQRIVKRALTTILKAIDEYGTDPRKVNYDYFLYHCDGGSNGSIHVVDTCSKGCHDGGDNKSDSCL